MKGYPEIDMNIESITGRAHSPPATLKTAAKPAADNNPMKDDSVAITDTAQGIKKALEYASTTAVVDGERVAGVKKAIADGSYQIDPNRIAEKMIRYEKLMP
jgi:negative regulator of flagellin synthesis FlgM